VDSAEFVIGPARPGDVGAIKQLLTAVGLPTAGVDDHWRTFLVARHEGRIVGCCGSEAYQLAALIRSVAVLPDYQRHGLGRRLVRQLLDRLSSHGLREFYLLTTSAEQYFEKRGFTRIEREEIHPQLLASRELQDACPSTAVCMRLVMLS
jgi:amino-acid N-acetyltransferase